MKSIARRWAGRLVMLAVAFGILTFVLYQARDDQAFTDLRDQPKQWSFIAASFVICFIGVLITYVRWYLLVRALGIRFRFSDAVRLGFLGYLFNFVSLGIVGGDLFKAIFIAREQPGRRTEAVATVVIDRVIGLYGLFLLATAGVIVTGQYNSDVVEIRTICWGTIAATALGGAGVLMLLVPGFTSGALSEALTSIPKVGATIGRLIAAIRIYRRKLDVLAVATALSIAVHGCVAVGIYFLARGLPGQVHNLANHFVIVPMSVVTGVLPLPLMALGAFEAALNFLYETFPAATPITPGKGLVVALCYRLITIAIAAVGMVIYLYSRSDVDALLQEADHVASADAETRPNHDTQSAPAGDSPAPPSAAAAVQVSTPFTQPTPAPPSR